MEIARFVTSLSDRGGLLKAAGDRIEYRGPKGILTDEDRAFLRRHKDAVLAWLRTPVAFLSPEEQDLLAIRRHGPDDELLLGPHAPDLPAWTPPADWGTGTTRRPQNVVPAAPRPGTKLPGHVRRSLFADAETSR